MKAPFIFLFFLSTLITFAQTSAERTPDGGGEYYFEKSACLTPEDYAGINARLTANMDQLREEGRLPEVEYRNIVAFGWPLRAAAGLTFNSYYGIGNFVDQNTTSALADYNCGTRVYDGHNGIDIGTWPFPWYLTTNNLVEVVAAADGTIIGKDNGNADDHCSCFGTWNAVYVQHSDGSIAWYGHMKNGSLTTKTVGQSVTQGEYLGVVASSGCSTGPHLHFEVYETTPYTRANLIEPFQGACNTLNAESWWAAQQAYEVPTLNAIATHNTPPVFGCPAVNESTNFSNTFNAGATGYFGSYYRDQLLNQMTSFRILRPNNSVWRSWTLTSPNYYSYSWWYYSWVLPTIGPNGVWTYEATFGGQTLTHNFTVTGALPVELIRFQAGKRDKHVWLNWATASERNSDYFEVERSADGQNFAAIGQVRGHGTSAEEHQYEFWDKEPLPGTNYYRLRQADFDGHTDYSDIVQVRMTTSPFVVSPNPTTGQVDVSGPLEQIEKIRVFDGLGKLIHQATGKSVQAAIDLSAQPNGMYLLEITHSAHLEQWKILKK